MSKKQYITNARDVRKFNRRPRRVTNSNNVSNAVHGRRVIPSNLQNPGDNRRTNPNNPMHHDPGGGRAANLASPEFIMDQLGTQTEASNINPIRRNNPGMNNGNLMAMPECDNQTEFYCRKRINASGTRSGDSPEMDGMGGTVGSNFYWDCCPRFSPNTAGRAR